MKKKSTRPKKRQKAKVAKKATLILTHHARILPPSDKLWNRGAVFQKWELDEIEKLARRHRCKIVIGILKTKRI